MIEEIRALDGAIAKDEDLRAQIDVRIGNNRRKREALFNSLSLEEKALLNPPAVAEKSEVGSQTSEAEGAHDGDRKADA